MANKKWKLSDGDLWATDGVYDFGQSKTQRQVNASVASDLSSLNGAISDVEDKINLKSNISLFKKIGIIGDSYASGEQYYDGAYHDLYELSWGKIIERDAGICVLNYAKGGMSLANFLDSSHTAYNTYGYGKLSWDCSNNNKIGLFIFALGINDANNDSTGANVGTFSTRLTTLINNINTLYSNSAKIVLLTFKRVTQAQSSDNAYNEAIISVGNNLGIPVIDTRQLPFFNSDDYVGNSDSSGHPTPQTYAGMANAWRNAIEQTMCGNDYFNSYNGDDVTTLENIPVTINTTNFPHATAELLRNGALYTIDFSWTAANQSEDFDPTTSGWVEFMTFDQKYAPKSDVHGNLAYLLRENNVTVVFRQLTITTNGKARLYMRAAINPINDISFEAKYLRG